jgi:hypothetical protein
MPRLTTPASRTSTNGSGPPDHELLRSLRWTDAAPKRLAASARQGDVPGFARELRRDFRRRFGREPGELARLAARFPQFEGEAKSAFERFDGDAPVVSAADETVALLRTAALLDGLRFGGSTEPDRLWHLWREAWTAANEVHVTNNSSPLARLLAAEVQWAAGVVFAGVVGARARLKNARAKLFAEFDASTDTDGTPHAALLPVLPAWFASLVRVASWAKSTDLRLWDAAFSGRFDGLVRTVATLAKPGGRLLLAGDVDLRPILREAAKRSRWKVGSPVRQLVRQLSDEPPAVPAHESHLRKPDRKSPPVLQSDWAKLALSRSRWQPAADAFAVAHHGERPAIEFLAFGRPVFAGAWGLNLRIDGRGIEFTPEWEAVSWFSDAEADYLELQWPNELGVTVCRQILLTRGDHQLLLAESVAVPGRPEARVEIESTLPLATGVTAEIRRPSRELRLDAGGLPVRAFPVAFPAERIDRCPGVFEPEPGCLVLKGSGTGAVYLPVVFDWNPKRREAFVDWRSLTVTEDRRRLGPAEASGHRLRVGGRQLLVYRRLNESKAMRTVLGYHHGSESVVGRFTADGDVEPLVLVE